MIEWHSAKVSFIWFRKNNKKRRCSTITWWDKIQFSKAPMTTTSSRLFKKLSSSYSSSWMNKKGVFLFDDSKVSGSRLGSPTVNATKLGADPACVVSENQWKCGGHKCINENDKSYLQEHINSMCVSCVLTQVLAISWKKDMSKEGWIWIPLNYSTQFVWLLKKAQCERSVKNRDDSGHLISHIWLGHCAFYGCVERHMCLLPSQGNIKLATGFW